MISHPDLHTQHFSGRRKLVVLLKQGTIQFAGNRVLKIYGRLSCTAGKRMKTANRVFFINEQEAIEEGYRPCGHCLHHKYLQWKKIK